MYAGTNRDPAAMVAALACAARHGEESFLELLERVPAAAYRTDRDGLVTHYNRACTEFAGRQPVARQDRWCVTWKLYTEDGAFLPHDQCPMAVALREGREVRGVRAVAERPDGRRVPFAPYPTPLRDKDGKLVGAINLLVALARPEHEAIEGAAGALRSQSDGRKFRAIFANYDPVGVDSLAFEAANFSEALAMLAELDSREPFQLWCDGSFFGRFQRMTDGGASYWKVFS